LLALVSLFYLFDGWKGITVVISTISAYHKPDIKKPSSPEKYEYAKVWPQTTLKCTLLFPKVPKCASSTFAGVARKIALGSKGVAYHKSMYAMGDGANFASETGDFNGPHVKFSNNNSAFLKSRNSPPKQCMVRADHFPMPNEFSWLREFRRNNKVTAFAMIRNNMDRALSWYYWQKGYLASQNCWEEKAAGHPDYGCTHGLKTDDKTLIEFLDQYNRTGKHRNYVTWWLDNRPNRVTADGHYNGDSGVVEEIFKQYDFIGLIERADESLVVLKHVLGLEFKDILYNGKSKDSSSRSKYMPKFMTPHGKSQGVLDYMKREEQILESNYDQQLWNAANRSLDLTIKSIANFERELNIYKTLMERVHIFCNERKGYKRICIYQDEECSLSCLIDYELSDEYKNIIAQY